MSDLDEMRRQFNDGTLRDIGGQIVTDMKQLPSSHPLRQAHEMAKLKKGRKQ